MTIEYSLDLKVVLFRHLKKKSLIISCRETIIYCLDNVRALHTVHAWSTWSQIHTFPLFSTHFDSVYVQFVHLQVSVKLNRILGPMNHTTTYLTRTGTSSNYFWMLIIQYGKVCIFGMLILWNVLKVSSRHVLITTASLVLANYANQ